MRASPPISIFVQKNCMHKVKRLAKRTKSGKPQIDEVLRDRVAEIRKLKIGQKVLRKQVTEKDLKIAEMRMTVKKSYDAVSALKEKIRQRDGTISGLREELRKMKAYTANRAKDKPIVERMTEAERLICVNVLLSIRDSTNKQMILHKLHSVIGRDPLTDD